MAKLHQKYALVAFVLVASWTVLQFRKNDFESMQIRFYIDVAPLYLLMTFGSYCLFKLGYDVMTFNDYPKEIEKLSDVSVNITLLCLNGCKL